MTTVFKEFPLAARQATVDALWLNSTLERLAGSSCAIPANLGVPEGAACYCAGTNSAPVDSWGYCGDPAIPTPQQVNLQFGADGDHVQVSFATLDHGATQTGSPIVELCDDDGSCVNVTGRTALAPEPQNPSRVYSYHFVPLPSPLKAATAYSYRARGGTTVGAWSPWMRMATRDPARPLRFAIFGDQGVYPFNNMGNLIEDRAGGLVDLVVHLGDAAYNLAMQGGGEGAARVRVGGCCAQLLFWCTCLVGQPAVTVISTPPSRSSRTCRSSGPSETTRWRGARSDPIATRPSSAKGASLIRQTATLSLVVRLVSR